MINLSLATAPFLKNLIFAIKYESNWTKKRVVFLKFLNSLRSNSTNFLTEYHPFFLLRIAFSGNGQGVTGVTSVGGTEALTAVMHKRRLSASGERCMTVACAGFCT